MKNKLILGLILIIITFNTNAQSPYLEFGLGTKYDVFKIKQSGNTFENNIDLGATAFISYGRPFINKMVMWEVGIATNNYKLNVKVNGDNGLVFSGRELVSVMRSNRIFLNLIHLTKQINDKLSWSNSLGFTILFGAKNPYDVILQRSKEIETPTGNQSIDIKIKTYGLTGSSILISTASKLNYKISKDFNLVANLGLLSGFGETTKVEIDYVLGSSSNYKKAIFTNNGFAPMFTLGLKYNLQK